MKKIFITLLALFVTNLICVAQNVHSTKYKVVNAKNKKTNNSNSKLEEMFLDSMIFEFCSNKEVIYLSKTETLNIEGVNQTVSGDEHIYVNYLKNVGTYNLNGGKVFSYKPLKFKKEQSSVKILGMPTTKHTSADGNIIVYTSKNIPWYVQPCILTSNQFNEGVVKVENLKTNIGFELIEDKAFKDVDEFKKIQRKVSILNESQAKLEISPFLKLE